MVNLLDYSLQFGYCAVHTAPITSRLEPSSSGPARLLMAVGPVREAEEPAVFRVPPALHSSAVCSSHRTALEGAVPTPTYVHI